MRRTEGWRVAWFCWYLFLTQATSLARVCPSMDIRNLVSTFSLLEDCHRIQGFLQVVLLENSTEADFADLSFPNLTEVTSFVIFYRVGGLTSIGRLFPNLSVIGGDVLVKDYALIITQMPDLKEIDLVKLRIILRGSVAIVKNPKLCYVDTVDWDLIATSGNNWISPTKDDSLCPGCSCPGNRCWSRHHCQVLDWGKGCDKECLGGCRGPAPDDCIACKHFIHGKRCVAKCPDETYEFEKRRCVSGEECRRMNETLLRPGHNASEESWFTFGRRCVSSCPRGLERDPRLGCKLCPGRCVQVCDPSNVESIGSAQLLKDCTYINGSLEIQIRSGNQAFIARELEENLGAIEEIAGYLKITRSFPLTSLNFLKNLRVIHGAQSLIWPQNYSLIVLDNHNLQSLWDWDNRPGGRNFSIPNGRIFFHYNPNLCLKHIREFASISGQQNVTNLEVATESNGNKFACDIIDLHVTVSDRFSTAVTISIGWPTMDADYSIMRYRYMVYYIKAPFKNLTADYETSECADYRWSVNEVSESKESINKARSNGTVYYTLHKLDPYTQYAFFVKTYTINSTGGQSSIQYFKTLPSRPTWPNEVVGFSPNSSSITLFWKPPDKANGLIKEYFISRYLRTEEHEMLAGTNYCLPLSREVLLTKNLEAPTDVPDIMTKVVPVNDERKKDCCNKNEDPVLDDESSLICQNLNPNEAKLPSSYLAAEKIKSCEKYMYNVIGTSVILQPNRLVKRSIHDIQTFTQNIDMYHKDFEYSYQEKVAGETSSIEFTNLEPYSLYTFEVRACREADPGEKFLREEDLCSIPSVVTVRTRPDPLGDKIAWLTAAVQNKSVELRWEVPPRPNLLTLSYDIEYLRTDIPNFRPTIDCIPAADYHRSGYYSMSGLAEGTYAFRVRAISLAGVGNYTEPPVTVSISEFSSAKIILAIVILTVLVGGIIGFAIFMFRFKQKMTAQRNILIASVNPEYLGIREVDEEWELPRERIQIKRELKRGNFGVVFEGLLLPDEQTVAVKQVVENVGDRTCIEFLNEASVMKQFTSAFHIVKLIGIVSREWPQLVVMEMMEKGDLKTYLRECRDAEPPHPPTLSQLLLMAAQIADGMAFLENAKFVHRDLAARNCMVREDLTVKIGDFGMTRDVIETDYYRKGNKGLLPIRWMAPESLNDGVFTSKSDAWSYGIVLWEIVTLATQPYQGMSNEQVLNYVVSGNKLDLPPVCPKPFKTIMQWCWRWKAKSRPSFLQILELLSEHTTKAFREVSFYDSPEGRLARETLAAQPDHCRLEPATTTASYQIYLNVPQVSANNHNSTLT